MNTTTKRKAMTQHGTMIAAHAQPADGALAARFSEIETTVGRLAVYGVYECSVPGLPVSVSVDGLRVHVGGLGSRSFVRAPYDL
jgi:hypothetical protein